MATNEAMANEAEVRKRLRRHEVANTLAILAFSLGIVALAVIFAMRSPLWHRSPPRVLPAAVAPDPPRAAAVAPAEVAVQVPAPQPLPTRAPAAPLEKPRPEASSPRTPDAASTSARVVASPPGPAPSPAVPEATHDVAAAKADASAMDRPSGPAAKRMLNSIKCFDAFAYEGEAGGRQVFSALCKGGNRMEVSCAGAGCKIEYAPAPSHLAR